jgi:hypothetical protein
MGTNIMTPPIVTNGLVLALDAANQKSYVSGSNTWRDLSGNVNNGTLTNGPTFNTDNGGTIVFDGTNDYINLGNILNYTSQPFTISYWVYFNSLNTNVGGQGPVVIFKGAYAVNGYYDQIASNGQITFITNQSGVVQSSYTDTGAVIISTWYNIVYTRNGASVRIYINGIDKINTAGTHINPTSSANNFNIANYGPDYIYGNFRLSNFINYNRSLSAAEVQQNYNAIKSRFDL